MITTPLRFFAASEFAHPELVQDDAAQALEAVRERYGEPLEIASDGRPLAEELAALQAAPEEAGKSHDELEAIARGSLHVQGRAFDLRWPVADEARYRLVEACIDVAEAQGLAIELEPVPTHLHVAFFPPGTPHGSRLVFA